LGSENLGNIKELEEAKLFYNDDNKNKNNKENKVILTYEYWGNMNDKIEITPKSKSLLFFPKSFNKELQECEINKIDTFNTKEGIFLNGIVEPGVHNVEIKLFNSKNEILDTIYSDEKGKFSFGPLYDEKDLKIVNFFLKFKIEMF
jgi:hypothetical protein